MARVLIPQNIRRYDHNPKGSSTAVVTMKGHNPFERRPGPEGLAPMMHRVRGGLAGLGDTAVQYGPPPPPAATPAPAPATTGINWGAIAQATATAIQPLAAAEAQRLLQRQTAVPMNYTAPSSLPVGYQPVAAPKSKMPWIVGGVGAVAAIGVLFLVLRRR
jgi:hypothetical protein